MIVAGVALLNALFFARFSPFSAGDSADYWRIAAHLASGQGYEIYDGVPTVFRPPVYPLFLAGVYRLIEPSVGSVLVVQAGVAAVGAWLLYLLARRLVPDGAAFAGSLAAGAYPHLAFYSATLLAETLTFALLAVSLLLASGVRDARRPVLVALLAGIAMGVTALAANRFALFPVAVLAALAIQEWDLRTLSRVAACVTLGYGLALSPWILRNQIEFGVPIPFTVGQQGVALWAAARRVALYDYKGFYSLAATDPLVERYVRLYRDEPEREHELLRERQDLESAFVSDALRLIRDDPISYAIARATALPRLWIQPAPYAGNFLPPFDRQNWHLSEMVASGAWPSVIARLTSTLVFTVGLFATCAIGVWRLRHRSRELVLLYAPAVYVLAVQAPLWVEHRYSVLAHPFLWIVGMAGIASVVEARKRRGGARLL